MNQFLHCALHSSLHGCIEYKSWREEILRRRAEQKQRTIDQRLRYNLGRWNQKPRVELKLKP
jgi:hypothetical protein